jgi:hypothetical protein
MKRYTVIPLSDFEGDPFGTEDEYLVDEGFADAVGKLEPSWSTMSGQLLSVLHSFDESGLLRPVIRARFPAAYAQYEYDRQFVRGDETRLEWAEFDTLRGALHIGRRDFDDPARVHPVQEDPTLGKYLSFANSDELVDWKEWTHQVSEYEPKPGMVRAVTRTSVKSFYAEWQRLRAWALLESHTMRFLINPKEGGPERIRRDSDYDLTRRWLMSTSGGRHYEWLLKRLEDEGWLTALYRSRALVNWAELRTWRPTYQFDDAASSLTADERWDLERPRLISRSRALAERWSSVTDSGDGGPSGTGPEALGTIPIPFRNRVRAMLELWQRSAKAGHNAFAKAVSEDLAAASTWAIFAFETTFADTDEQVGILPFYGNASLGLALRPDRTRSRRTVESHAQYLLPSFNDVIREPRLSPGDFALFLDFLEQNELWAWTVELANLIDFREGASDTVRDRRFLHLRSLALLNEQISAVFADIHGTDADRDNIGHGTSEGTFKVFLAGRPDWRHDLWTAVSNNKDLTRTNDRSSDRAPWKLEDELPERVAKCVRTIDALKLNDRFEGAAKHILLLWTLRNFGAHRFSRDAELLEDLGPRFASAVIFCPIFYWKVATTMG